MNMDWANNMVITDASRKSAFVNPLKASDKDALAGFVGSYTGTYIWHSTVSKAITVSMEAETAQILRKSSALVREGELVLQDQSAIELQNWLVGLLAEFGADVTDVLVTHPRAGNSLLYFL